MSTLQRCFEYLDRHRVRYAHTIHPVAYTAREVAAAEHMPLHKFAKSVAFVSEDGYGVGVLPADALLDLDTLRSVLGVRYLRLAHEEELGTLFPGGELGAMPPFGNLFGLPVFLDRDLAEEEFMAFNAGTHQDVIHMSMADFSRLVRPVIAELAVLEGVAAH